MQNTYALYIGSNNETKRLELKKIQNTLDKYLDGYTIIQAAGAWEGIHEKTAVVEIATDQDINPIIQDLKNILKQDAIAYRTITPLAFA